jgi:hypothetical protein
MPVKELRFALDEKGVKALAETLVGKEMSYWEENRLRHGRVSRAEVKRDRYGNSYVETEVVEAGSVTAA